jgi:hypothetical protein
MKMFYKITREKREFFFAMKASVFFALGMSNMSSEAYPEFNIRFKALAGTIVLELWLNFDGFLARPLHLQLSSLTL